MGDVEVGKGSGVVVAGFAPEVGEGSLVDIGVPGIWVGSGTEEWVGLANWHPVKAISMSASNSF